MIVWGGYNGSGKLGDGARYNPDGGIWAATTDARSPGARQGQSAVWTGSIMIVFGGVGNGGNLSDTFSYDLPKPMYLYQKP